MPNYSVKEGSTVSVVVSLGQNLVTVPKVTGLTQDEATTQLEEIGLDYINSFKIKNKDIETAVTEIPEIVLE